MSDSAVTYNNNNDPLEHKKVDRDSRARGPELEYDESDAGSVEVLTGVSKVEAVQAIWYVVGVRDDFGRLHGLVHRGPKSRWFLFIG
jgi:hypothetical protein